MGKKMFSILIALLITSVVVTALWLSGPSITGMSIYKVRSDKTNITLMKSLIGGNIDTTNSSVNFTDYMQIDSNINGDYLAYVTLNKIALDQTCVDIQNDCNVSLIFSQFNFGYGALPSDVNIQIFTNTTLKLQKGMNYIDVYGNCQQYSCPQNISVRIDLVPIAKK